MSDNRGQIAEGNEWVGIRAGPWESVGRKKSGAVGECGLSEKGKSGRVDDEWEGERAGRWGLGQGRGRVWGEWGRYNEKKKKK